MTDKIEYYLKVTRGFRFYAVHAGAQKAASPSVKFRKKTEKQNKTIKEQNKSLKTRPRKICKIRENVL